MKVNIKSIKNKSDNMNILKNYNEKELTLSVEGRIDTLSSNELEDAVNAEMGNFDSMIIDFKDLDYISSAGLRVLIITQKKLVQDNIPLVIKNANEDVKSVFKTTGLNNIINIE